MPSFLHLRKINAIACKNWAFIKEQTLKHFAIVLSNALKLSCIQKQKFHIAFWQVATTVCNIPNTLTRIINVLKMQKHGFYWQNYDSSFCLKISCDKHLLQNTFFNVAIFIMANSPMVSTFGPCFGIDCWNLHGFWPCK